VGALLSVAAMLLTCVLGAWRRVMLWMGGLRPTEGLGLVREELQAQHLLPAVQERLQRIMEDCYQVPAPADWPRCCFCCC
jgi:hypothetical protein